jgi:hypothetical protein
VSRFSANGILLFIKKRGTLVGLGCSYEEQSTPFPPEALAEMRELLESRGGWCNIVEEGTKNSWCLADLEEPEAEEEWVDMNADYVP